MSSNLRRLIAFFRRNRLTDELHEEIQHHLELRRRALMEEGLPPGVAEREARRRFGNVVAIREQAFALWSIRPVDTMVQDVRYGLRMIRKSPGFTALAISSLAVGIGASTIVFSFGNAVLFRPLHAANPSELVQVFTGNLEGRSFGSSSHADYEDFRDGTAVFSGLLASMMVRATLSDLERPELVTGALVSANFFDVVGLPPSRGRFFLPDETRTPGTHPVVVLSHEGWLRRYAADPEIVGRVVGLNGHAFTVIGVGPPRFTGVRFESSAEFFVPVMMQSILSPGADILRDRGARAFAVLGRLKNGVGLAEANAALQVIAARLLQEDPAAWRDRTGRGRIVTILPELDGRFAGSPQGAVAWTFSVVIGAVVSLLGIACVNVATVLLARATNRRKEIAVRLAIGASRGRVVQQLLTECALLATVGGILGVLLAQWAAGLFPRFRPDEMPPFDLTLDYRILIFGLGASLLTILLFGLAPALQATRPDVNAELKDTGRTMKVGRFRVGLRDALVVVQVAVSLTLIIGGTLLFRSFLAGRSGDPGFRRDGVFGVEINLSTVPPSRFSHARFYREAVQTVGDLPGVDRVALAALVPMDGSNRVTKILIERGGAVVPGWPDINVVGAGYFALMDIPVIQGREFGPLDREGAPRVAVVNETMTKQYLQGEAIGRIFTDERDNVDYQIVGVIRDLPHRSFVESPRPMAYFCADQQYVNRMTLHVRTSAPPGALGLAVQRRLHEIHPAVALEPPLTMAEHMDFVTLPQRLGGMAAAVTGLLELGLAVMALYGVVAFATAQRTREIGVRMALGASSASVIRLIMRDGIRLAGIGVGLGMFVAVCVGPALRSLLIGVGATDPLSFLAPATLLMVVAAMASYAPARRAVRVDPSVALRNE